MIVEFIGVPGVGKTTIIAQLRECLSQAGIPTTCHHLGSAEDVGVVADSWLQRNLVRVVRVASTSLLGVAAALRVRGKSTGADLLRLINREVKRRALKDDPSGVVLIDEGSLHKLCMLHADARVARPMGMARWVSNPDMCVVLESEPGTAAVRIRARSHPHKMVDRKTLADLQSYLTRYTDGVRLLERRLRCPVVHVSTETPDAREELHTALIARFRTGPSTPRSDDL